MWLDQSLKHGWLSALPVADWLREHLIVQLRALRNTIFSVWLAYTVVWMAYGLRLISSTLLQVGPELEEAARSTGASRGQITRHVTVPLSRYGLIGSWLLMFLIFEREYSTGVYLLCRVPKPSARCWCRCGRRGPSISSRRSPLSIFCWW